MIINIDLYVSYNYDMVTYPMSKITINDFKGATFDSSTILVNAVSFDTSNKSELLSELDKLLFEIQSLRESVIFKVSKLKTQLSTNKNDQEMMAIQEIESQVKGLRLGNLGTSHEILQMKMEVFENKKLINIMMYKLSKDEERKVILETLINSENVEDWEKLSDILYANSKYGSEDLEIYAEYSKRLANKLESLFKEIYMSDITLANEMFMILESISYEYTLIDSFLLSSNLISYDIKNDSIDITKIDLNNIKLDDSTVEVVTNHIKNVLLEHKDMILKIFGSDVKYQEYMISRIFKTIIAMHLEKILSVDNPALFLFILMGAYESIMKLAENLNEILSKFDYSVFIEQLFDQFINRAVSEESKLFEEIITMFLDGRKNRVVYSILGETVQKTDDLIKIYNHMMILVDSTLRRGELIYKRETLDGILTQMGKRLGVVIDKISTMNISKKAIMDKLRYIYLLNIRIFRGSYSPFQSKVLENINQVFNSIFEKHLNSLKSEIYNIKFGDSYSSKGLLDQIDLCFSEMKILQETSHYRVMVIACNYIQNIILKHISRTSWNSNKLENLKIFIDSLCAKVTDLGVITIESLEKFKVVPILIGVKKNLFLKTCKDHNIDTKSFVWSTILKARNDGDEIKELLSSDNH